MTCSGCSGAVTRVLEKAKADGVSWYAQNKPHLTSSLGVTSYNVNLDTQEVLVKGTLPYDDVLARIKKTGKEVNNVLHSFATSLTYWAPSGAVRYYNWLESAEICSVMESTYIKSPCITVLVVTSFSSCTFKQMSYFTRVSLPQLVFYLLESFDISHAFGVRWLPSWGVSIKDTPCWVLPQKDRWISILPRIVDMVIRLEDSEDFEEIRRYESKQACYLA